MTEGLIKLQEYISKDKPKKLRAGFKFEHPLKHGWMLPYLLQLEDMTWGRWNHWAKLAFAGQMGEEPIPQIAWCSGEAHGPGRKAWEVALNAVTRNNDWAGWSSWRYVDYCFDWVLFGLGDKSQPEEPTCPGSECAGCSERLYQVFNLEPMLAYPYDYLGDILAENSFGRRSGFFPTPVDVCAMMVKMQMDGEDCRAKTVCDPAVGTGRMILAASNYSYRLFGIDINATVIKACLINGWLYAPWLVKPLPFFETYESAMPDAKPVPQVRVIEIPGKPQLEMELV